MVAEGKVELMKADGIATVSFYHPQSNSLPGQLLNKLANTITEAGADDSCKLIVLKSEGEKAFCAGASFDELIAISDIETGKTFFTGFSKVINAIRKCPKFVVARIQGKTVGGGVGIAAAADYSVAHSSASVKLSELAVGIGPFVVGPAVERKVGAAAFSSMAINATAWWPSDWAQMKGLFTEVFNTIEEVDECIENLAKKLASSNPEAMRKLKEVFWAGTENWDELLVERAMISGELVLSEFTRNAINKFKQGAR